MVDWKEEAILFNSEDVDAPNEYWNASPEVLDMKLKEPAGANDGGLRVLVTVIVIVALEIIVEAGNMILRVGLKNEQVNVAEVGASREHTGLAVEI